MNVSQTSEYALRAVVQLARAPGQAQTTNQLARATSVPQSYLPKVLQPLARAGFVAAQRGSRGGYRLATHASQISVLDIVNCLEPVQRLDACQGPNHQESAPQCRLHHLLDEAHEAAVRIYRDTTISSLVDDSSDTPPLCAAAAPSAAS